LLKVNGKGKAVVHEAERHQRILELLDRAETIQALREGLESVRRGETMPLAQFDEEMRKKIRARKNHVPEKWF
jgi:hypothetical protein